MAKVTLKMPKGAVSMQEGTILEWLVASGDRVAIGQPLYTLESEKAVLEIDARVAGTLTILTPAGATVRVGQPIAEIEF